MDTRAGADAARWSRGEVAFVGSESGWATRPPRPRTSRRPRDHSRLDARRSARSPRAPGAFDVVVCDLPLLVPLAELAWCLDSRRVLAWGRLAGAGPGIFGPNHGTAADIAGQGVADPSSMLLAAALMLGEGLGKRSAARDALLRGLVRPRQRGRARGRYGLHDHELTDAVLAHLPHSHSNAEFLPEAV